MKENVTTLEIPIHDIKPLIEIQEYSFIYLIILTVVVSLLLMGIGYLLYIYLKNKNKFNIRAEHYKLLKAISLDDAKKSAYDITLYGMTFEDDSLRHKQNYEALVDTLETYKYKKDVEKFDEDVKRQFERYLGMIDV